VVSTGCPAGIGPEVSVAAAAKLRGGRVVLVGDVPTLERAAALRGVPAKRLGAFGQRGRIELLQAGPALRELDRKPGRPSRRSGAAQLAYVAAAYDLVKRSEHAALVTGPVSKEAVARSGAPGAQGFLGHTEWLRDRDGAEHAIMCFACERLSTSLVTTHLPLAEVPNALTVPGVVAAIVELATLLRAQGHAEPLVAVASLNPHAGEGELLGVEEARVIVPALRRAARQLRGVARVVGPIGAETAYRKAAAGSLHGVVAMYHDQATIPMKLLAFGDAVNVSMGLGVVRTSVDHGTGYDIAWRGEADARGMLAALELGARLVAVRASAR
jgi:4-hydroxythreonine-4-phosphate dehydrogenase